jgi:hypothetical protein
MTPGSLCGNVPGFPRGTHARAVHVGPRDSVHRRRAEGDGCHGVAEVLVFPQRLADARCPWVGLINASLQMPSRQQRSRPHPNSTPHKPQECVKKLVKAAKTNESQSYAHTLAGNTHYFSRPGNASVDKGGKQKEETRAQDKQARGRSLRRCRYLQQLSWLCTTMHRASAASETCCASEWHLDWHSRCNLPATIRSLPYILAWQAAMNRRAHVQHLTSAARHFRDALRLEPSNIYAANGLGAVCASMNQIDAARKIFSDARESAATLSGFVRLPDVRARGDALSLTPQMLTHAETHLSRLYASEAASAAQ